MLANHRNSAPTQVRCGIITVSDTRNKDTDKSGSIIQQLLKNAGHQVIEYEVIPDEQVIIKSQVEKAVLNPDVDAVIVNGGTGIAKRDVTIESIQPLLSKELPGFGELFRYLSYELDIGSASILSRAIAGIAKDTVIFSVPGSSGAVKLAMEKLILPELGHVVMEINKDQ
ncbi:MogA/MoaB family molybdenum cofactor biosynthesis protein [Aquibacillus albus]|uniref:Molybdenum cofactor biosynthesis protein B n=1 Tax=Aquibacillus albus TaxID=1168171 RepID=A0ABS2MYI3_9BACI|nr:molybdenum cofactor biosynthesis protein B [Aquibacillus albus]MBM7570949.1 molybdenum cofactor biosynthesis protein B [Aquibacillus albus]